MRTAPAHAYAYAADAVRQSRPGTGLIYDVDGLKVRELVDALLQSQALGPDSCDW